MFSWVDPQGQPRAIRPAPGAKEALPLQAHSENERREPRPGTIRTGMNRAAQSRRSPHRQPAAASGTEGSDQSHAAVRAPRPRGRAGRPPRPAHLLLSRIAPTAPPIMIPTR
jgi:hypothetical protein